MENEKNKFQEQHAPLKNHDDAFVQVGRNGEPVFPGPSHDEEDEKNDQEHITTQDKR